MLLYLCGFHFPHQIGPTQTSKMERFVKIVNSYQPLESSPSWALAKVLATIL